MNLTDYISISRFNYVTEWVKLNREKAYSITTDADTAIQQIFQDVPKDLKVPKKFKEALNSEFASLWKWAMDAEMAALHYMGTWEETPYVPGTRQLGAMWVYDIK